MTVTRALPLSLFTLARFVVVACASCASIHEEPPAPPPAPVDPAAFNGPARPPAADVDLSADLDGGNPWLDAGPEGPAPGAYSNAGLGPPDGAARFAGDAGGRKR